jgi:hypothetical protein
MSSAGIACAELAYLSSTMAQHVFTHISDSGETSYCNNYSDNVLQASNDTVNAAVLQTSVSSGPQFDIARTNIVMEHLQDIPQQPIHIHHGQCDAVVPVDIVEQHVKRAPNTR